MSIGSTISKTLRGLMRVLLDLVAPLLLVLVGAGIMAAGSSLGISWLSTVGITVMAVGILWCIASYSGFY